MRTYSLLSFCIFTLLLTGGCDGDETENVAATQSDTQSSEPDSASPEEEAGNVCFYTCAGEATQCITEDSGGQAISTDFDCDLAASMMCPTSFDLESYAFYENCTCDSMDECAADANASACSNVNAYCDAEADYALVTCTDGVASEPANCEEGLACYHIDDDTAACVTPNSCIMECYLSDTQGNGAKDLQCQTTTDEAGLTLVQSQEECDAVAASYCEGVNGEGWTLENTTTVFSEGEDCGDFENVQVTWDKCEPGEMQCVNENYQECEADGVWSEIMECPEGQQCTLSMGEYACQDI